MALTATEKKRGKEFLARWAAELAKSLPPASPCSPYVREIRHDCPGHGGASIPVHLREEYRTDELFAVFWKEGRCPGCGLAFRSALSRLFLAAERPPAERRVVRAR